MGRKNLLGGLMEGGKEAERPASLDPERPRLAKGAIGAITRSVADLKARALVDLDPGLIDAGGLQDRIESDPAEDEALKASLAEYGQQVPVLVRPHPETEGRYQIVYGRRRVLALRELGMPVKALVRLLDDRDVVIAQGQENTARRDLSFIEKANFARQMVEAGYDRKIIGDTLSMDKTLVSRMLSVAERVPEDLIQVIGAAPSVGRDRWMALAAALETSEVELGELVAMVNLTPASSSDARFGTALDWLSRQDASRRAKTGKPPARLLRSKDGVCLAEAEHRAGRLILRFVGGLEKDFEDWLLDELPSLHQQWRDRAG